MQGLVGSTTLVLVSQLLFYFVSGGTFNTYLSLLFFYSTVIGLGFLYTAIVIPIKTRTPPENLNKTLIIA